MRPNVFVTTLISLSCEGGARCPGGGVFTATVSKCISALRYQDNRAAQNPRLPDVPHRPVPQRRPVQPQPAAGHAHSPHQGTHTGHRFNRWSVDSVVTCLSSFVCRMTLISSVWSTRHTYRASLKASTTSSYSRSRPGFIPSANLTISTSSVMFCYEKEGTCAIRSIG